jgi:hypothetical protein
MPTNYTIVDTCGFINLAIPLSATTYDHHAKPDPLNLFFQTHTVAIPAQVEAELKSMARFNDLDATAATNILQLPTYTVEDPLSFQAAPNTLPNWPLDDGETAAILYANIANADYMFSDEFTSQGEIVARLKNPDWQTTPDLLADFVDNGYMTRTDARTIINLLEQNRSLANNSYVQAVKQQRL